MISTIILWVNKMRQNENILDEIEQERASYLLNLDDMNYEMLVEPQVIRNKSAITPNSYIGMFGEINLVNELIYTEDRSELMELVDNQNQIELPTREFHQLRPATLKDKLTEDRSHSK